MVKKNPLLVPGNMGNGHQKCAINQLLKLSHFLGHWGCTVSTTRETQFVGYGAHFLYLKRAAEDFCSLQDRYVLA